MTFISLRIFTPASAEKVFSENLFITQYISLLDSKKKK